MSVMAALPRQISSACWGVYTVFRPVHNLDLEIAVIAGDLSLSSCYHHLEGDDHQVLEPCPGSLLTL